jgi:hypothetical protein
MSRSFRKPYWTCGYGGSWKREAKARANNRVKAAKDLANGAAFKKVSCSWDICDYKMYDAKGDWRVRRK